MSNSSTTSQIHAACLSLVSISLSAVSVVAAFFASCYMTTAMANLSMHPGATVLGGRVATLFVMTAFGLGAISTVVLSNLARWHCFARIAFLLHLMASIASLGLVIAAAGLVGIGSCMVALMLPQVAEVAVLVNLTAIGAIAALHKLVEMFQSTWSGKSAS